MRSLGKIIFSILIFSSLGFIVFAQDLEKENSLTPITETISPSSFDELEQVVKEKTPNFLIKPFVFIHEKGDKFRQNIFDLADARRARVVSELNDPGDIFKDRYVGFEEIKEAFRHLEIFLLILVLFILGNQLIFYPLFALAVILSVRFVWYRIY